MFKLRNIIKNIWSEFIMKKLQQPISVPNEISYPKHLTILIVATVLFLFIKPEIGVVLLIITGFLMTVFKKTPKGKANKHFTAGKHLIKNGRPEGALAEFIMAAEIMPDVSGLNLIIAELYEVTGKIEQAVEYYEKYLNQKLDDRETEQHLEGLIKRMKSS